MFIDTHCHPLLSKEKTEEFIIENFQKSGGKYLVSIGTNLNSSKQSLELANRYDCIYSTIGIHPTDTIELEGKLDESIDFLEDIYLADKDKVVGVGECGLDYHWLSKENTEHEKKIQKEFFLAQIKLAKKYKLPLIIHNRDAGNDILDILSQAKYENFIIHCFSENLEFAKKCIEISPKCKLAFGGIVTFKNTYDIQEAAQKIPLENLIIETDSPYLTPTPYRGKEENEPKYVQYVLEKIIELRDEDPELIKKQIFQNSLDIFNI
ncbi:TatD family deoxyribonuclease [Candidatus Gracilibacteria bacterium 28_42_T64]|nr:TatD family deoxyribonuclease [Candidatus Gracilibacteria bacterium 28_42_T64]